jgi:CRISPR-associated protein Csd1
MYRELVELGRTLEAEDKLPPAGFSSYREPIKWLVHLWPDHAILESVEIDQSRPFSGRTSGVEAHLLADEAAYALGVSTKADGSTETNAIEKHQQHFRPLYQRFLQSEALTSGPLREAIGWLDRALEEGWLVADPNLANIRSKDWVSFMPESGSLTNKHLYDQPDAQTFWMEEMQRRCSQSDDEKGDQPAIGECSICGEKSLLIRKLPLKVKLAAATPLHSLNQSAFTSFYGGPSPEKRTHLGMCFACGELSARTFNFLGESGSNRKLLVRHPVKTDALMNQYALYWLKAPGPVMAGEVEIDLNDLGMNLASLPLGNAEREEESTLQEMTDILNVPWTPKSSSLQLSDYGFYLAILSPNVGRIAVREWLPLSVATMKESLRQWLSGTTMEHLYQAGRLSPASVMSIVEALEPVNADMTRALIRTAFGQGRPPVGLLFLAGNRLNTLNALEPRLRERKGRGTYWDDNWPHALASAIRLVRMHQGREDYLATANTELDSVAFHCGRLLAVLEEAQQVYTFNHTGSRLDVSIVQRGYGGASTTPASVLGRLYRLATSVHLPEAGGILNKEAESIAERIAMLGGMPKRLTNDEQADFGLGFYQERSRIRRMRKERDAEKDSSIENDVA